MKKIRIGCGVVAVLVLLLVVVAAVPYLSIGSGSGSLEGWRERDYGEELYELAMHEAGLDAPGAVNGFDGYVAMVELFEEIRRTPEYSFAEPQSAARMLMGTATEEDLAEPYRELGEIGLELLKSPRLQELDAAIDAFARSDGAVGPIESSIDYSDSWMFEHGSGTRALARLFDARSQVAAWRGDTQAAVAHIGRMVALTQPYNEQPLMIGRLIGIAIKSLALVDVRRLALVTDDLEVLEALDAVLDRASSGPPISYTLEGERLIGLAQLQSLPAPSLPIKLFSPSAQAEVLSEFYDRAIEWASTPIEQRVGQSPGAWADGLPDSKYSVAKILLPAIDRFIQADDDFEQAFVATRAVIAVRRYELVRGELPATLGALVPEFLDAASLDPVNGKEFIYRAQPDAHTGAPFTLYSLGRDGIDHGGEIKERFGPGEWRGYGKNFTAQWVPTDQ